MGSSTRPSTLLHAALGALACSNAPTPRDGGPDGGASPAAQTSSIAVSADGRTVYVVNTDADAVTALDPVARTRATVFLAGSAPVTAMDGRYDPSVSPRALALSPDGARLYVTGQRSGRLYTVDLRARPPTVLGAIDVGSEPVGLVLSPDGTRAYVALSQDDQVVEVDLPRGTVARTVRTARKPWALTLEPGGRSLLVTHLLGPGVSTVELQGFTVRALHPLPALPRQPEARLTNGVPRALYDVAVRPGSAERWVVHTQLSTETAQSSREPPPADVLNFETTVFPVVTLLAPDGRAVARLASESVRAWTMMGGLGDIVSGPRALVFTPDGRYAFLLASNSEQLLVLDAERRVGLRLGPPLPGHLAEGLALSPDGARLYVQERNSETLAVFRVEASPQGPTLAPEGDPLPTLDRDPMPARMRLGQHVFHSADSAELPITSNHWVACASCHTEGRTAAVTQRFTQGPRDVPSNAGGMLGTGFLFRTAARRRVQEYWRTINVEQGGRFNIDDPAHDPTLDRWLDAVTEYVNFALPYPVPPRTLPARVARGQGVFERPALGCVTCHPGPLGTDSGQGNPTLDLAGPVLLHDVGTCATGAYPDQSHTDFDGRPRGACAFDTPVLRGLADSAPYLHDGSAATLAEAVLHPPESAAAVRALSPEDRDALVEYLRSR